MNDVLLRLLRAARGNGVRISVAEAIDAFHTVDAIGYDDRQALKDSLSLTLAKTVEEKILFEDCFDLYFRREVMARQKDIQFASRADSHIARQKQIHRLRHVIRELHRQMPAAKQAEAKVKELASWGCGTTMHVAHLLAPRVADEDHSKDIDFSSAGIRVRREAGQTDARAMLERAPWTQTTSDPIEGVIEHV